MLYQKIFTYEKPYSIGVGQFGEFPEHRHADFECNFCLDGEFDIVIDRKNFLFANTPKGATGSAVMFSLIQTAIKNGLDSYRYLTWLMKTAKDTDLSQENMIQALLPWNAPKECKAK